MMMWSGRSARPSSCSIAGMKSSPTVQQMQPFESSIISSSRQVSSPHAASTSLSTPRSPNSLMISAMRLPLAWPEQMPDQRRLARAEKAGDDRDGDLAHAVTIAPRALREPLHQPAIERPDAEPERRANCTASMRRTRSPDAPARARVLTRKLRRADHMRQEDQHNADRDRRPRSEARDPEDRGRRCERTAPPPDLPRDKVGRRHARQFRRQPERRRQLEHRKSGQSPHHAIARRDLDAAQHRDRREQQGKAHRRQQIRADRVADPLHAILRRPGVLVMLMCGDAFGMLMRRRLGRCRIFIKFGREDQWRHAPLLQCRHARTGNQSGKKRCEKNIAETVS